MPPPSCCSRLNVFDFESSPVCTKSQPLSTTANLVKIISRKLLWLMIFQARHLMSYFLPFFAALPFCLLRARQRWRVIKANVADFPAAIMRVSWVLMCPSFRSKINLRAARLEKFFGNIYSSSTLRKPFPESRPGVIFRFINSLYPKSSAGRLTTHNFGERVLCGNLHGTNLHINSTDKLSRHDS